MNKIVGIVILILSISMFFWFFGRIDGKIAPKPEGNQTYLGRVENIKYIYSAHYCNINVNTLVTVNGKRYGLIGKADIRGISNAWVYRGNREENDYLRFIGLNGIESVHVIWDE